VHGLTKAELAKYAALAGEIRNGGSKAKTQEREAKRVEVDENLGTVSTQTPEELIASEFEAAIARLDRTLRTANAQLKFERDKRKEFELRMIAAGVSIAYEPPEATGEPQG
jgi:hypothetical protein